jgi:hypothetical protein
VPLHSSLATVLEQFKTNQVVLLGERHGIAENLDFIAKLVPDLWRIGVRNIALEFFATENQAKSDALVSSPEFDDQIARDLLFEYNVGWPFVEYQSIHKAVWEFNRANNAGMRVLHPSYIYDWTKWTGIRTEDSMQGVFHRGHVNEHRATVIADAVGRGEKALGLFGAVHAINDKRTMTELGFPDFKSVAQILEQQHSIKVSSVNINDALDGLWEAQIKTAKTLNPCNIDFEFISGRDFSQVQRDWPDPDWQSTPTDEQQYWQIMRNRRSAFLN